jgi:hypothetical protein
LFVVKAPLLIIHEKGPMDCDVTFGEFVEAILHLVMDLKRQRPPRENRAPGTDGNGVGDTYRDVVRHVFSNPEVLVTDGTIDRDALQAHLDKVNARGKKYIGEG